MQPQRIITYTGKYFWYNKFSVKDIDINTIAHALSMTCRYGGHCRKFYSVAEHSVLGARYILSKMVPDAEAWESTNNHLYNLAKAFTLHDATEAYLLDVQKPLKNFLGQRYIKLEHKLSKMIFEKYDVPEVDEEAVKEVDLEMLHTEAYYLMPDSWEKDKDLIIKSKVVKPRCWSPTKANLKFLELFNELFNNHG